MGAKDYASAVIFTVLLSCTFRPRKRRPVPQKAPLHQAAHDFAIATESPYMAPQLPIDSNLYFDLR
jgi:hypothetical protein